MILSNRNVEPLVDDLLCELDAEIDRLDARQSQLVDLSAALVQGDDSRLEELLEAMDTSGRLGTRAETQLSFACKRLGNALGCYESDCRLSMIIERLDSPQALEVQERRDRIVEMIDSLRNRHMEAVMLLRECSRMNRLMLECLTPRGESLTVYGAGGTEDWQNNDARLDTEQ